MSLLRSASPQISQGTNNLRRKLFAHYKQATEGDIMGDRPGFMDFVGGAKYDAWSKLKGMSEDAAMTAYIKLVERVSRE
jgi:diazepam-binding inhibitor (GABA receptor modulator, acyl-CoA-binding protein)